MAMDPAIRSLIAQFRSSPNWNTQLDVEILQRFWPELVGGQLAAVAEEHRHRLLRMSGHPEDRHPRRIASVSEFDDVAILEVALARELRTHPRRGVPRNFRQRLRQFLEPPVIREASVPHHRIRTEDQLESAL